MNDGINRLTQIRKEWGKQYYLHAREGNSFHFRLKNKWWGAMQSFTITYTYDGTVCMTGDMGDLVWRRNYCPNKHDYGFPFKNTGINYFEEKLVPAFGDQEIKEFDQDLCEQEIREWFLDYENDALSKEKIDKFFKFHSWEDYEGNATLCTYNAYQDLTDEFPEYDWSEFYDMGLKYKDNFKMRFALLQQVSELIIEEVNKE